MRRVILRFFRRRNENEKIDAQPDYLGEPYIFFMN